MWLEKGVWLFILSKIKKIHLVKQMIKYLEITAVTVSVLFLVMTIKYKPAYAVILNNDVLGYVDNKEKFQELIDENVLKPEQENIAFVSLDNVDYSFRLVNRDLVNTDEVLSELKSNSKNIYKVFEVSNGDDEETVFFNSINEANEYVDNLKQTYEKIDTELKIDTLYLEDEVSEETIQEAKAKIIAKLDAELQQKEEEEEEQRRIESQSVNGIYLACLPVTGGTITSRFGASESVRDHVHQGIDIGASYGTPIKATADGKVKYAGSYGGYGNLVIIDHGNGIETYYGHCSKIYTYVGAEVKAGDTIAGVGSTGNSTGNHCHFEIRVNGSQVNPQKYLYN